MAEIRIAVSKRMFFLYVACVLMGKIAAIKIPPPKVYYK